MTQTTFTRIALILGISIATGVPLTALAEEPEQPKVKIRKIDGKELIRGEEEHDHAKPDQKPEAVKPEKKKVEARVSAEAKKLLAEVTAAYKKAQSLEVTGTLTRETIVGSQTNKNTAVIMGSFLAPGKFRHEIRDSAAADGAADMIVGSTGEKVYAFRPGRNDYKSADAPKARGGASSLPSPMRGLLDQQNPGLMCAVVDDAGAYLAEDVKQVDVAGEAAGADGKLTILAFKGESIDYKVLIDPETHLVRQIIVDAKRMLSEAGVPNVEKDELTYNYKEVKLSGDQPAVKAEAFAWAAPSGAKDAGEVEAEEGGAMALVGKEAPDFSLKGLDGKAVALKDSRGSVVVLDFWATWCGPCKVSLPGLNKLHKELAPKGLVTYAIDLEEPKEKVQPVAEKLCPDLTVLLDEDSKVSKQFGVSGIPQTVVIGKDGKIRKVFIGSGNDAKIKAAVEAAMKE